MAESPTKAIKKAKKESQLLKELSRLFLQLMLDDHRLQGLTISRVSLSADKSICTIFFYAADGEEFFEQILPILILYKPSLRKSIAQQVPARYTPELVFKYDKKREKQQHLEELIDKLKEEGQT
jgi:ribosome-binding factor A